MRAARAADAAPRCYAPLLCTALKKDSLKIFSLCQQVRLCRRPRPFKGKAYRESRICLISEKVQRRAGTTAVWKLIADSRGRLSLQKAD